MMQNAVMRTSKRPWSLSMVSTFSTSAADAVCEIAFDLGVERRLVVLDGEQVVGPGTQLGESDSAQEGLQAVPLHEGERRLEEVEASQRRKLVEHQKEAVTHLLGMKILGQSPSDLVEQQAYQRLGAADGRRPSLARPGESV